MEGVHDGLPGRDAHQGEGPRNAPLHPPEVGLSEKYNNFLFLFRENGQIVADLIFTAFDKVRRKSEY